MMPTICSNPARRIAARSAALTLILAVAVLAGCDRSGWRGRVALEELRQPIQSRVEEGSRPGSLTAHQWEHVQRLYRAVEYRPIWVAERGLRPRAGALLDVLATAPGDGLRLGAYPLAELHVTLEELRDTRDHDPARFAEADVLLTSVFAAYGEDMLTGQVPPRSVAQSWHIDPRDENVDSVLAQALRARNFGEALARLRPDEEEYEFLRRELGRFRQIAAQGGWPLVPEGDALHPGDSATADRLRLLVERLRAEGLEPELTAVATPDTGAAAGRGVYDGRIAGAVARFQRRHGIDVDSILGGQTLQSLNEPVEFRLRQVAANLERHRWMPRTLATDYVLVNVPAFELDVHEGGQRVLSMRVVVGAEYQGRATPVFADSISFVVFRPYWNVPDNIAERDLWPQQRRDPGFFARNNYEVVTAGGRSYVRQRPGPRNALGDVKFMFPNDFAIYLHDTPAGELFQETVRAFSNGCIRVEKPAELAEYLLRAQGWDLQRVRAAMESGPQDRQVNLERRVPVYIVYFTTYERDGRLHFANDIYERDSRLIGAMAAAVASDGETARVAQAARQTVHELVRS